MHSPGTRIDHSWRCPRYCVTPALRNWPPRLDTFGITVERETRASRVHPIHPPLSLHLSVPKQYHPLPFSIVPVSIFLYYIYIYGIYSTFLYSTFLIYSIYSSLYILHFLIIIIIIIMRDEAPCSSSVKRGREREGGGGLASWIDLVSRLARQSDRRDRTVRVVFKPLVDEQRLF